MIFLHNKEEQFDENYPVSVTVIRVKKGCNLRSEKATKTDISYLVMENFIMIREGKGNFEK